MKLTPEKQVKEKYPNADYVKMGWAGFNTHSVYADSSWKVLLGQSTVSKKEAWQSAADFIASNS